MKHYKIVVSVSLPDSQKEQLRPFLSNVGLKNFKSLGLAMAYVQRIENKVGQCYRNFYMRYYCNNGVLFVYQLLLVSMIDGRDFASIGIQEVES